LNAMRMSGLEVELMRLLIAGDHAAAQAWLNGKGWIDPNNGKPSREAREFAAKADLLGIKMPGSSV